MSAIDKGKFASWLEGFENEIGEQKRLGPYSAANIINVIRMRVESDEFKVSPQAIETTEPAQAV